MSNPTPEPVLAVSPEDIEGITQCARDYVESWYAADGERMRGCLHPNLAKRTIMYDPGTETWSLRRTSDAEIMVGFTQEGGGSDTPEQDRIAEITILDVFRHIASVRVLSHQFVDHLHIARLGGRWLIVNALWELREGEIGPDF